MALAFLLTVLFALSPLISCHEYCADNFASNVSRSAHPVRTGLGTPNPPCFTFDELLFLQNRFWKNFLSPANADQVDPLSFLQTIRRQFPTSDRRRKPSTPPSLRKTSSAASTSHEISKAVSSIPNTSLGYSQTLLRLSIPPLF